MVTESKSKIRKTFEQGRDVADILNWFDDIIWAHVEQTEPRDPAEIEYFIANKIKVTIEIYNE